MAFDEYQMEKRRVIKDILGEIASSEDPNKQLKKWRTLFRTPQKALAMKLGVTSSVVSDYESGRRKSPGVVFLRKYVEALIEIDESRGGEVLRVFIEGGESGPVSAAILDIKEFPSGVGIKEFTGRIGAKFITATQGEDEKIYGYTLIDSVKAITELSFSELRKLYGVTTQRALVFTNITTGKGPLIAIKVANLKPALIVLHNISESDVSDVARDIAEAEGVPLSVCEGVNVDALVEKVESFSGG